MINLQEKYQDKLDALQEVPEEVIGFHSVILLKNIIGSLIAPLREHPAMFESFMDLVAAEFNALGYDLIKHEAVKEENPDKNVEKDDDVAK